MPGSSLPQRAVWPSPLPQVSIWLGVVGVLLAAISLILTGNADLSWWVKVGILLIVLLIPVLIYAIGMYISTIWRRVKQYDLLYDGLEHTALNIQQLQENFALFLQTLMSAGHQVFGVTGIEWGNVSPLLTIDCNQQGLVGKKLVVINISTLDILGRFEVIQATIGGYFAREERISNAVWWGYLREQMSLYPHPRIVDAVAILLP